MQIETFVLRSTAVRRIQHNTSKLEDHCAAGRIMSMKNSSDTNENRNRDFPSCCAMPQPPRGYHLIQDESNAEGIFTACCLSPSLSLVLSRHTGLSFLSKMRYQIGRKFHCTSQLRDMIGTDSIMGCRSCFIFSYL